MKKERITANRNGIMIYEKTGEYKFVKYEQDETQQPVRKKRSISLTETQSRLYRRLMYGINSVSIDDIQSINAYEFEKINSRYIYAQKILNKYKSKKRYEQEDKLLQAIFKHIDFNSIQGESSKNVPLRKLNISVEDTINMFIKEKLLPQNFYEL